MKIILSKGYETEIDDIDADLDRDYNWYYHHEGYAARSAQCNDPEYPGGIALHVVILKRKLERPLQKGLISDHKDRNKLNNHRDNLREVTLENSNRNRSLQRNNTSGYRGVSKNHQRWRAYIRINGAKIDLGTYDLKEKAYEAYLNGCDKYNVERPPEAR